jgi:hypothetical protein
MDMALELLESSPAVHLRRGRISFGDDAVDQLVGSFRTGRSSEAIVEEMRGPAIDS